MILALGLLMLGSSESLEAYWEVLATSAMLATLAGLVAAGRVVLRARRGDEPSAAPEPAVPPIRASWRAGAGFTAAAVVFFLLNQSDVWLANLLLESERAAHYAAAARLVVLVSFGLSLVNAVASPSLARAAGRPDWAHFSRLLRAASAVGLLAGMVILIPLLTFPEVVLGRLYAASYAEGASVLRVLLIGQAVSLLVGSCGTALLVLGEHRGVLVSALVGIAGTGLGLLVASGGDFSAQALAASFAFGTVCYQLALYGFLRMRGADSLPSFRSVFRLIRASPGSGG
jgi:O-antigen/teichoic acid export membrane protein